MYSDTVYNHFIEKYDFQNRSHVTLTTHNQLIWLGSVGATHQRRTAHSPHWDIVLYSRHCYVIDCIGKT